MQHFKPLVKTPRRWRESATLSSDLLRDRARAPIRPQHTIDCSRCGFGRGVGVWRARRLDHDMNRRFGCRERAAQPPTRPAPAAHPCAPCGAYGLSGAISALTARYPPKRGGYGRHTSRCSRRTRKRPMQHRRMPPKAREVLARCACTAPSRVLEGATAGQHRPDPGPARRMAAASQAFRTHVIIHDRDPALDGAWAALQARYRARIAKVNIVRQPRCATTRAATASRVVRLF